jgi:hypothetical protein
LNPKNCKVYTSLRNSSPMHSIKHTGSITTQTYPKLELRYGKQRPLAQILGNSGTRISIHQSCSFKLESIKRNNGTHTLPTSQCSAKTSQTPEKGNSDNRCRTFQVHTSWWQCTIK